MTTKETDETGREILVYPSGARKWADNGQWLNGPTDPAINPILRDPSAMQKRGQELIRQRSIQEARDALDEAAIAAGRIDESLRGSGYGWFAAIEKAGELYFSAKSARGAEGLLTVIARATGNMTNRDETEKTVITPGGITATPESILRLIEALDREAQRRADGRVNVIE